MRVMLAILVALLAEPTSAQPLAGIVRTKLGPKKDNIYGIAVDSKSNILAVGASHNGNNLDFAVLRYLPNGQLDPSFGDQGAALFDSDLGDDQGYQVLPLADDKILAVGTVYNGKDSDFIAIRFLRTGQRDASFGRNGVVRISFGVGKEVAFTTAIQPDGKILVGGSSFNGRNQDFAVARLSSDGKIDKTFGDLGKVVTGFFDSEERPSDDYGYSLLVQPDGKILLTGYSDSPENSVFVSVRYLPNGHLDRSFNGTGTVISQLGSKQDRAYDSFLQEDGNIVVVGSSNQGAATVFAAVRYLPDGTLDTSFGLNGFALFPIGDRLDTVYSASRLSNGRVVLTGSSYNGADSDFAMVGMTKDGLLDRTFGRNGLVSINLGNKYDAIYSSVPTPDGKFLVGGVSSGDGADFHLALAKLSPEGRLDSGFGGVDGTAYVARHINRDVITAEVGLPGWVFPFIPGGP